MDNLTISEKIRILSKRKNISLSSIASSLGKSPANFLQQLKRDDFRVSDLKAIASILDCDFVVDFIEK